MPLASGPGAPRPKNFIGDKKYKDSPSKVQRRCLGIVSIEQLCRMKDKGEITEENFQKMLELFKQ